MSVVLLFSFSFFVCSSRAPGRGTSNPVTVNLPAAANVCRRSRLHVAASRIPKHWRHGPARRRSSGKQHSFKKLSSKFFYRALSVERTIAILVPHIQILVFYFFFVLFSSLSSWLMLIHVKMPARQVKRKCSVKVRGQKGAKPVILPGYVSGVCRRRRFYYMADVIAFYCLDILFVKTK